MEKSKHTRSDAFKNRARRPASVPGDVHRSVLAEWPRRYAINQPHAHQLSAVAVKYKEVR